MINNFKALSKNLLRKKALLITNAGYEAINIEKVVRKKIKISNNFLLVKGEKIDLNKFRRIFILGIGKGSALASLSLAKILGKRLLSGIALDITKPKTTNRKLQTFIGTHPLPSAKNIKTTKAIVNFLKSLGEDDLLVAFICGGGSALLCGSKKEMEGSILVMKKLTEAGANIIELNTVRKHLSEVKGGGLAKLAYPATVVSLIVSDILGDDLSMVASGPFIYDRTDKKKADKILKTYGLGLKMIETPKDKKYFKKTKNILFVSNKDAISEMFKKARQLRLKPRIYSLKLKGEAKNAMILGMGPLGKIKKGSVVIAGGETTIRFTNQKAKTIGKGGRNQEAVLGVLVKKIQDYVFLGFASDGRDNTEAAGAIGDYLTIEKAKKLKLNLNNYLNSHSTFDFFKKTGDLIYADKNSFNVSDLMIVLRK
ncbi:MAG: DUF4147 domain-containing protein [Candidatus Paceibacterota bacterium]|jgi:glycerate-2-kinase